MQYENDAEHLRDDLKDPHFTCYVHIGSVKDLGWQCAVYAVKFIPQVNIYLFRDHAPLHWVLNGRTPKAIAFGWKDSIEQELTEAQTKDLKTVMKAMADAK